MLRSGLRFHFWNHTDRADPRQPALHPNLTQRWAQLVAQRCLVSQSGASNGAAPWRDPRYARVIGRLVAAGVMETNVSVDPHREPIRIEDALWVARVGPRVLELLPSLIVKCPGLFVDAAGVPPDLRAVVRSLRKGEEPEAFRGSGSRASVGDLALF